MKLQYIANARIPTEKANGYQISKMCEEFSNNGIEVDLILPTRDNEIKKDLFDYYNINKNFKVIKINSFDFFRLEKYVSSYFCFYLQYIFYLARLLFIKIKKDSIVYTRDVLIAWIFKIKKHNVILELHSIPEKRLGVYKFLIKKVNKFIVLTSLIKKKLITFGIKENKILVSPDGVDFDKFNINISKEEARTKTKLSKDKFIIGYTGNFSTMNMDKGIEDTIKALGILKDKNVDILFVAVGGTEADIDYYKNLAEENNVSDRVNLRKRVDLDMLAIYQKAFDAMLMNFPDNKHYREYMSPLKMFEYMVSKRLIIASDLPSIRDVLNEGNCLFCMPRDENDLADKILKVIKNQEFFRKISNKAFENVREYTWNIRAKTIKNFIF